jgi:hypothetical protein
MVSQGTPMPFPVSFCGAFGQKCARTPGQQRDDMHNNVTVYFDLVFRGVHGDRSCFKVTFPSIAHYSYILKNCELACLQLLLACVSPLPFLLFRHYLPSFSSSRRSIFFHVNLSS